jgi:hypothetical protein
VRQFTSVLQFTLAHLPALVLLDEALCLRDGARVVLTPARFLTTGSICARDE